ncbi:hypothetical protein NADFUDRAFT_41409 [Nadsonia fulvescens var. elongata DSM 6958]|uniref:Homeobox domain-containing protein n=1 Tax=Nadsonia fulvescens var. elongata DSM 6958 TaxID=857566 RepID=A0A1E3PMW6_9ASCO|nr:hypothetical protein NADFUDRAFT_41409 [Nadsonia fulvescens var. elongata DSM 6958]
MNQSENQNFKSSSDLKTNTNIENMNLVRAQSIYSIHSLVEPYPSISAENRFDNMNKLPSKGPNAKELSKLRIEMLKSSSEILMKLTTGILNNKSLSTILAFMNDISPNLQMTETHFYSYEERELYDHVLQQIRQLGEIIVELSSFRYKIANMKCKFALIASKNLCLQLEERPIIDESKSKILLSVLIKLLKRTSDGPLIEESPGITQGLARGITQLSISDDSSDIESTNEIETNSTESGYDKHEKNKLGRRNHSGFQLKILKTRFSVYNHIGKFEASSLGKRISLSEISVQNWFANERRRQRTKQRPCSALLELTRTFSWSD